MAKKSIEVVELEKQLRKAKERIKELKDEKESARTRADISNCNFTGIHWDAEALDSIRLVAQGLVNLTEVFRSQKVQIDCLLKIEAGSTPKKDG